MEPTRFLPAIVKFFRKSIPTLQVSRRGKMFANSGDIAVYLRPDTKLYRTLCKITEPELLFELIDEIKSAVHAALLNGQSYRQLYNALLDSMEIPATEETKASLEQFSADFFSDDLSIPLSELRYISNVRDEKSSFLYHPDSDTKFMIQSEVAAKRLRFVLGTRFNQWLSVATIYCDFAYKPNLGRLYREYDNNFRFFNMWTEAEWRKDWVPTPVVWEDLPEIIREYFEAFIPENDSLRAVLAWLRDATFGRAEPILVLCAQPGTGKNILVQKIAASLVGIHNYRSATRSFHRSGFHANVSNCRLFFLDEMSLTAEGRDSLKAYHNGFESLERKGKDVGDPEKIHASFVLANNTPAKVRLEYTDRKFFAPTITKQPLVKMWGQTKIDDLIAVLSDENIIRLIASYLHYNFAEGDARLFPKTELFKRLCINSFPVECRAFIHICMTNKQFNSKSANRGRRKILDPVELKDFTDLYESQFGEPLATITFKPDLTWTAQSHIYSPTNLGAMPENVITL